MVGNFDAISKYKSEIHEVNIAFQKAYYWVVAF